MRLRRLDNGHDLPARLQFTAMHAMTGYPAPDIVKIITYRKDYWGKRMSALTQAVMRGPSEWAVGERELFAAFVSRENQCPF